MAKMNSETPHEDLIRYDMMVQEALLGVVRRVLTDAARIGLQGDHHFYITFKSQAQGVRLSSRLREKYPEEMTIVLQHQFWDLMVNDHAFEVGLSFGGVPERLLVPFDALTGFYDPSVQFGLKFAADEAQADNDLADATDKSAKAKKLGLRAVSTEPEAKNAPDKISALERADKTEVASPAKKSRNAKGAKSDAASQNEQAQSQKAEGEAPSTTQDDTAPTTGAQVVSLDAFRKKK